MRYALEKSHGIVQIGLALLIITLIAFALGGCPLLGKDKSHGNKQTSWCLELNRVG